MQKTAPFPTYNPPRDLSQRISGSSPTYAENTEVGNNIRRPSAASRPQALLVICAFCKKSRDSKGHWNWAHLLEGGTSGAMLSHSFCPECAAKNFPEQK